MPRPRRNPFYPLLGIVGVVFTITAASYCLSVLRSVRPETAADRGSHPLERIMDRHGTAILTVELAVLAIATFGAIALDQAGVERTKAERAEKQARLQSDAASEPDDGRGAP